MLVALRALRFSLVRLFGIARVIHVFQARALEQGSQIEGRINVDDDGLKAQASCSALAQHFRPNEGMKADAVNLLAGALYWLELVKDSNDGLWKIKHWIMKSTWAQGDWGVFGGGK